MESRKRPFEDEKSAYGANDVAHIARRRIVVDARRDAAWNAMLQGLRTFKEKNGHLIVSRDDKHNGQSLGTWVVHQRKAFRESKLMLERQDQLVALGLNLDPCGLKEEPKTQPTYKNGNAVVDIRHNQVVQKTSQSVHQRAVGATAAVVPPAMHVSRTTGVSKQAKMASKGPKATLLSALLGNKLDLSTWSAPPESNVRKVNASAISRGTSSGQTTSETEASSTVVETAEVSGTSAVAQPNSGVSAGLLASSNDTRPDPSTNDDMPMAQQVFSEDPGISVAQQHDPSREDERRATEDPVTPNNRQVGAYGIVKATKLLPKYVGSGLFLSDHSLESELLPLFEQRDLIRVHIEPLDNDPASVRLVVQGPKATVESFFVVLTAWTQGRIRRYNLALLKKTGIRFGVEIDSYEPTGAAICECIDYSGADGHESIGLLLLVKPNGQLASLIGEASCGRGACVISLDDADCRSVAEFKEILSTAKGRPLWLELAIERGTGMGFLETATATTHGRREDASSTRTGEAVQSRSPLDQSVQPQDDCSRCSAGTATTVRSNSDHLESLGDSKGS